MMKRLLDFLPDHVATLLNRLGIVLMSMYLTRLVFLFSNIEAFQNLAFLDFLVALWFDVITIAIFFLPYYILYMLPIPFRHTVAYKLFFRLLFHITNALMLCLNLMDVEYFRFTSKRSTYDILSMFGGGGNDLGQLWGTFLQDFWLVILIYIALIVASDFLYRKTDRLALKPTNRYQFLKTNLIWFLLIVPTLFII